MYFEYMNKQYPSLYVQYTEFGNNLRVVTETLKHNFQLNQKGMEYQNDYYRYYL